MISTSHKNPIDLPHESPDLGPMCQMAFMDPSILCGEGRWNPAFSADGGVHTERAGVTLEACRLRMA
jgi:hypothetical protein